MTLIDLKNCELVKHLIEDLDNNADWLCFFVMFSRFEYALKRSTYIIGDENKAKADWNKFGKDMKSDFDTQANEELKEAKFYLLSNETSPKKQIKNNITKMLDYRPVESSDDEIHRLINAVKRVRNNLFHGGKFPSPNGPIEDPIRNNKLIKHSITVLKYFLYSSPIIKRLYEEPLE